MELEGVEPSSREGNLRVFYMLSLSLVVGRGQVRDNRILTLVAKVSHSYRDAISASSADSTSLNPGQRNKGQGR